MKQLATKFFLSRVIGRSIRGLLTRWHYERTIRKYGLTHFATIDWARSDNRAWQLFGRVQEANPWIPRDVYPAGGAAGPLLLYLLTRIITEHRITRVLELGAGISTRVLAAWSAQSGASVVTVEHDASWAERMRAATHSNVVHAPLATVVTPHGAVQWYDTTLDALGGAGFDLVIVDGPFGTSRLSRFGIVTHLPEWLNGEWVILWDDLERQPDLESFGILIEKLRAGGVAHNHVLLDGDRTIGLIYTPSFEGVRYLW